MGLARHAPVKKDSNLVSVQYKKTRVLCQEVEQAYEQNSWFSRQIGNARSEAIFQDVSEVLRMIRVDQGRTLRALFSVISVFLRHLSAAAIGGYSARMGV